MVPSYPSFSPSLLLFLGAYLSNVAEGRALVRSAVGSPCSITCTPLGLLPFIDAFLSRLHWGSFSTIINAPPDVDLSRDAKDSSYLLEKKKNSVHGI